MQMDVSGWCPDWQPGDSSLGSHAHRLRSLLGHKVTDASIVWNLQHDEWFADLPVVINFDHGLQLELSWQKFDDLSITWNTIDLMVTPRAWVSWPLEWRSQAHPALVGIVGQAITDVQATQHSSTPSSTAHPLRTRSMWWTSGVWLDAGGCGLHVFNALDENGLSGEPPYISQGVRCQPI